MFREYPVRLILSQLERDELLPAILFRSARKQCDADVESLSEARGSKIGREQEAAIEQAVHEVVGKYGLQPDVVYQHPHYNALLLTATGAHHAGQLLAWRLLLEELMSRGLLRLLIATGTVAAGVDFPARTVVITSHSKRGSEGFRVILSSELQQMAGRAGRRGKDEVGVCLVAPSLFSDARVIHEVAKRPPEPLRSAYFAAPSTVLNLLKFRNVDDLEYTVGRSLASFLDRKSAHGLRREATLIIKRSANDDVADRRKRSEKRGRRLEREAEFLEERQLTLLRQSLSGLELLGFVINGSLTEKGAWAAELCTSLVLELAEAIDEGLFNDITLETLVGMVASISADPHRHYFSLKSNPIAERRFAAMSSLIERVRASYHSPLSAEVAVVPDAALTTLLWMECETWSEFVGLMKLSQAAPGDVARLITQTADHLNQIARLTKSHPSLAEMAAEGRRKILRPPLTDSLLID